ncbi:MAG TPA: hypothetical protein VHA55_07700 [Pseudorhodoplanes sp.]|nr:hypothetical protein [Pseudorhodoplanes sp.]
MSESRRFLEEARRCFEQAADCTDAAQMKIYAELGAQFLARAQEAAVNERRGENGGSRN